MNLKFGLALGAGVAGTAIAVAAALWQTQRADDKLALQAQWDAALAARPVLLDANRLAQGIAVPSRVSLRGEFLPSFTVYLDNRMQDGVAGFRVITPLRLAGAGPLVLVDRGFAARDPVDRTRLPAAPPAIGVVEIDGVAIAHATRSLELGSGPKPGLPGIWQNLDYDDFEAASREPVARLLVLQQSDSADGLRRGFTPPATGVDKHRAYAFQWWAIAALIVGLTLFFGFRRGQHASKH